MAGVGVSGVCGFAPGVDALIQSSGIYLAVEPMDLRCGIDRLLVQVHTVFGRDAFDGTAYVFRNRSGTRIKGVLGDATGVWLCVRRLQEGRFRRVRAKRCARSTPSSLNGCAKGLSGSGFLRAQKAWRRSCNRPQLRHGFERLAHDFRP